MRIWDEEGQTLELNPSPLSTNVTDCAGEAVSRPSPVTVRMRRSGAQYWGLNAAVLFSKSFEEQAHKYEGVWSRGCRDRYYNVQGRPRVGERYGGTTG